MEQLIIGNAEDYYSKFFNDILLKSKNPITKHYEFDNTFGTGSFEHIFIDNGIEIILNNMALNKKLEYNYTLEYSNFEIIYCITGSVFCYDDEKQTKYSIKAGDIKFVQNGNFNRWEIFSSAEEWKSISICFNDKFINQFLEYNMNGFDENNFEALLSVMMTEITFPEIRVAFNQIDKCSCPCSSICRTLYFQSKAIEIISLFIQNKIYVKNESNQQINFKTDDINKIKYAKEVITNNFIDPYSIKDLAKYIGLNTFKLKVGFKQIYNTTIYGYVRDLRMEKAREYLLEGKRNVIQIANMVGYSNPSHFSVAFKKKFGVNPSQLKN